VTVSKRRPEPSLGEDPIALLTCDRSGHVAAQVMRRDRSVTAPDGPGGTLNNGRPRGGYDAYFGTFSIDDERGTLTPRLLGALSQEDVGSVFIRKLEVRGSTLVIELRTAFGEGVDVTRTLTGRRVG
jgi:lipocalin-like protein